MFSFFKSDPRKKLKAQYDIKLEKAMQAQRKGDIRLYSELTLEAEQIDEQIRELEKQLA